MTPGRKMPSQFIQVPQQALDDALSRGFDRGMDAVIKRVNKLIDSGSTIADIQQLFKEMK